MTNAFPGAQIPNHDSQVIGPEVAISVRNLSKKYHLYDNPQHRVLEALHPFRKKYHHDFWALKDVSFEVKKGECLGIIGRNGSGKSTLLQLICGILQPSEGSVQVNGRISAILELGAGFNVEYTGTENIYANGNIMGFSKKDMEERYQNIVDFADLGDFINQPVKTYSSGMYVRLAFSCAVNVDPDILIVDEALAVGDVEFRAKCHLKMAELAKKSSVIYVTHELSHISTMCDNVLILDHGKRYFHGNPLEGIDKFNGMFGDRTTITTGSGEAVVSDLKMINGKGEEADVFRHNSSLQVDFEVEVDKKYYEFLVSMTIMSQGGELIAQCHSNYNKVHLLNNGEKQKISISIDNLLLNPSKYFLNLIIFDKTNTKHLAWHYAAKKFAVIGDFYGGTNVQLMGVWSVSNHMGIDNNSLDNV